MLSNYFQRQVLKQQSFVIAEYYCTLNDIFSSRRCRASCIRHYAFCHAGDALDFLLKSCCTCDKNE